MRITTKSVHPCEDCCEKYFQLIYQLRTNGDPDPTLWNLKVLCIFTTETQKIPAYKAIWPKPKLHRYIINTIT